MTDIIDELNWRGLIALSTDLDDLRKDLAAGPLTFYGGFDPTAPGQPRGAYLPFGAGNRICIGESFAWAEAVLILATLARRWAPATEPGQRVGTWAAVTLRPHPGIRMRLVST